MAGTGGGIKSLGYIACGYLQVTSLSAAAGLTIPSSASWALIECESQQVRWRDDGTAPTTTVGMLMNVGDILVYDGTKLAALSFIEVTSAAKLNVSFYS